MDFIGKLSFLVFLLCVSISLKVNDENALLGRTRYDYYSESFLLAEKIICSTVDPDDSPALKVFDYSANLKIAPVLLSHMFHDWSLKGCDASILLDPTASIVSEEVAPPKESLKGFDMIEIINLEAEEACLGVVSCADIDVLAARESLVLLLLEEEEVEVPVAKEAIKLEKDGATAAPPSTTEADVSRQDAKIKGPGAENGVPDSGDKTSQMETDVKRCGTSIQLDPTASIVSGEKEAPPNESLKGFDTIDIIQLAEKIIRSTIEEMYEFQLDVSPALVVHDYSVKGCDASILLDPFASIVGGEKEAPPNESLKGFDTIDIISLEAEEACLGVLSYADIVPEDDINTTANHLFGVEGFDDRDTVTLTVPEDDLNTTADHLFGIEGFDDSDTVTLTGSARPPLRSATSGSSSSRGGGPRSRAGSARVHGGVKSGDGGRAKEGVGGSGIGGSGNGGDGNENSNNNDEDGHYEDARVDDENEDDDEDARVEDENEEDDEDARVDDENEDDDEDARVDDENEDDDEDARVDDENEDGDEDARVDDENEDDDGEYASYTESDVEERENNFLNSHPDNEGDVDDDNAYGPDEDDGQIYDERADQQDIGDQEDNEGDWDVAQNIGYENDFDERDEQNQDNAEALDERDEQNQDNAEPFNERDEQDNAEPLDERDEQNQDNAEPLDERDEQDNAEPFDERDEQNQDNAEPPTKVKRKASEDHDRGE